MEATVKAAAEGQYKYETLYLTDPAPAHYGNDDRELLRSDLVDLLHEGSTKALVKLRAWDLISRINKQNKANGKKPHFKNVELVREFIITVRASSEDLFDALVFPLDAENKSDIIDTSKGQKEITLHGGSYPVEIQPEVIKLLEGLEDYIEQHTEENVIRRIRSYFMRTPCYNVTIDKIAKRGVLSRISLKTPCEDIAILINDIESRLGCPCGREDKHAEIRAWARYFRWQIEEYVGDTSLRLTTAIVEHVEKHQSDFRGELDIKFWTTRAADMVKIRDFLAKNAESAGTAAGKEWAAAHVRNMAGPIHAKVCRSFLLVSSHAVDGKADASIKATANIKFKGLGKADAEASASANLTGAYKHSVSRFQTFVRTASGIPVFTSYDTKIRYTTFNFNGKLNVSANAQAEFAEEFASKKGKGWDLVDKEKKYAPTHLNRMRYRSSVVVWIKPHGTTGNAQLLAGTGLIYGESFVVKSLRKIYKRSKDKGFKAETDKYIVMIADTLRITPAELWEFFKVAEVEGHIIDSAFPMKESASLLIEAGFRIKLDALPKPIKFNVQSVGIHHVPVLDAETIDNLDKLLDDRAKYVELESIRLRYRKCDHEQQSKKLFNLGFKVGSADLRIRLDKIEEAGSDAIVDLATVFVNEKLVEMHADKPADVYEKAVPPAILFCQ